MGSSPEQMRRRIDDTRADLSEDLDRLSERTSPRRIAHHRKQMVGRRVRGVRERVMGSTQDTARGAAGRVRQGAGRAAEAARSTPETARDTTGNPLAVGLIAFGAGLLAATVLPESQTEQAAGQQFAERSQGARGAAARSARQITEDVRESGQEAAERVRDTAVSAGKSAGADTTAHARRVSDQARESGKAVSDQPTSADPDRRSG